MPISACVKGRRRHRLRRGAITADIYASVIPKLKNDAAARFDRVLGGGA